MDSPENGPVRLLFVCMGNICRSPAAENVMRSVSEKEGLGDRVVIDSAGTIGLHTGDPPDHRMTRAARRRGIRMAGQARQITVADLDSFDWVLVMDEENLADVQALAGRNGGGSARIAMFCEFCTAHEENEVPDPYYGGPEGFEKVLDLLEDGCSGIIRRFQEGKL